MSHDAVEQSLAARIRSLSLAPDLQAILAELAERTEPAPPPEEESHAGEFEQMVSRARGSAPLRGGQHARPACHLRLISGGLAAFAAVAGIAWRWAWKSGAHQAAAAVVTAAMVGAAAVPVAVSVMPYSSPMTPAGSARHIHPGHHMPSPVQLPSVAAAPRRRRGPGPHHHHLRADVDQAATPTVSPAPSASATGSGVPTPGPTPTATPTPTSTTGDGDGLLPLAVVHHQGALRGLPWPNMLHHVSRGRDAAPG